MTVDDGPVSFVPMKAKSNPPEPKAIRISEAARLLNVSHWTVRRLIKNGTIRSCRILRTHLIPVEEIDRLLQ